MVFVICRRALRLGGLALALMLLIGTAGLPSAGAADAPKTYPTLTVKALRELIETDVKAGKVVLVNYFASWCPPCREEIPGLAGLRRSFGPDKLSIIGVSVDRTMAELVRFASKIPFNYPVYLASPEVAPTLGITLLPTNVAYYGKDVYTHEGFLSEAEFKSMVTDLLKKKPK